MNSDMMAKWCFDEEDGPLAFNEVDGAPPMQVRGAVREPGRTGGTARALCFRHAGDNAVSPGLGAVRDGTIGLWLLLDANLRGGTLLSFHEHLAIGTDKETGNRLTITHTGAKLPASSPLTIGRWTHIAVTFGSQGLTLFIDGKVAEREAITIQGPAASGRDRSRYITLCGLPSQFVPCAVDELSIYNCALTREEVHAIATGPVSPAAQMRRQLVPVDIDAADYLHPHDPTYGLQAAIDAADPAGGRVVIPVGRFILRRGLRVPSRVTLTGCGHQTVLVAAPGSTTQLTRDVAKGDDSIAVADVSGFVVGDPLVIEDQGGGGYNATHAFITAIEDATIHLSCPTWFHYSAAKQSIVARWFPMIGGLYVHDVQVTDLAIEGRAWIEPKTRVNFTASAVDFERSLACQFRNLQIRNWLHDGICLGKGTWHRTSDCLVRDGYGHGYHPGNRMRSCTWINNVAIHNGQDGLYFCCGVEDNLVANNYFDGNAWNGIGGLGDCDDVRNLVTGNQCLNNGRAGIHIMEGRYNTVTNNICSGNSRAEKGRWSGIHVSKKTRDAVITGNHVLDDQPEPTQAPGIIIEEECVGLTVRDNVGA